MKPTDTIIIESSDCMMWRKDQVIIDIMSSILQDKDITIFLKTEGPCAKALGLYELLDNICVSTGYDSTRFLIRTCNLKEHSTQYQIQIEPPFKDIVMLKNKKHLQPTKTITSTTQHFGQFIGHGNRLRLFLASYLHMHYPEKTITDFTFGVYDYHGIDTIEDWTSDDINSPEIKGFSYIREVMEKLLENKLVNK
jgi:hypothetical protein